MERCFFGGLSGIYADNWGVLDGIEKCIEGLVELNLASLEKF